MAELKSRASALKTLQRKAQEYAAGSVPVDLDAARRSIEKTWETFEAAHAILDHVGLDAEAEEVQFEFRHEAEKMYFECLGFLVANPQSTPSPLTVSSESRARAVKIKPVTIPTFKGDIMSWLEFRDEFTALVHSTDMDDRHKMAMLREYAVVPMVTGNYTGGYAELWKMLCDRYNDEFGLGEAWAHEFAAIPTAKDSKDGLLALIDKTRAVLRAFNQLQMSISTSALTLYGFLDKVPSTARVAWGCARTETGVPALEECMAFMERRAKNLAEPIGTSRPTAPAPAPAPKIRAHVGTVQPSRCACPQNHRRVARCDDFRKMTIQQRTQLFNDKGQCYICFGDHQATACSTGRECYNCRGPHNKWFCPASAGPAANNWEPRPAMTPQNLSRN